MRASIASILSVLLSTTTALHPTYSPFTPPDLIELYTPSNHYILSLFRRQNNCQSGFNACTNLGAQSACCSTTAICSADGNNDVACCPLGAACTGTINAGSGTNTASSTSGAFVFAGAGAGATTTGTLTTTTPSAATITATAASQSVVPNAFFPFPYIPTSYSNAAACSSYYSSCQTEFTSCTASLGGGTNAVTVTGGGAGITVQGASATASAASVCSSLSSQACFGLQTSNCASFGTGGATGTVFNPAGAGAGRRCDGIMYGVGVGVAVGLAGQVIG